MLSPELLRETLDTVNLECWERERTATPVRASPETVVSGVPTRRERLVKAVFLVDGFGYQTALARLGLSGRRD